jgi:phosphopantetheinyl transferase
MPCATKVSEAWPSFRCTLARSAEHPALGRSEAPPGLLSPGEERVLSGLTFPRRRHKWLLGRVALKRVVREELLEQRPSVPPESAFTVGNEPSGAPYIELEGEGRLPWAVSISHRADLGLGALCTVPGVLLGADLELVEPRDPALVRSFFTQAEQQAVAAAEAPDLLVARIWSAKEAVLKALGLGLRLDTRQVEVGPERLDGACPPGWTRLELNLGPRVPPDPGTSFGVAWRDQGSFVLSIALRWRA